MRYFYILCLVLICSTCNKDAEIQPKDYPYVITTGVSDINSTGVTFKAKILDYGREEITDFGFILSDNIKKSQYSLLDITGTDQFELRVSSDLRADQRYSVQAYIKTNHYSVFANKISFTSLGSDMPVITSFSPDSGIDGTTVRISGDHFSKDEGGNTVKIGAANAKVISAKENEIVIEIPRVNYYGKYKITLEVAGQSVNSTEDFTILGPHVTSVTPPDAEPGDKVTIHGDWLVDTAGSAEVSFDDIPAEIVSASLHQLVVIVPPYTRAYNTIHIKAGIKTVDFPYAVKITQEFIKLKPPAITGQVYGASCATQSKGYFFNYGILWEFDPADNTWTDASHYPGGGKVNIFMFALADRIYVGCGNNLWGSQEVDFWEYNPDLMSWKRLADFPLMTNIYGSFGLKENGYVISEGPGLSLLWQYNPGADNWIEMAGHPHTRDYAVNTFVINDIAYMKSGGDQDNFVEYDESSGDWIPRADCPMENYGNSFSSANRGYCLYGYGEIYEYNPEKDNWVTKQPYPGCNNASFYYGFSVNNKVYIGDAALNEDPYCHSTFYNVIP